TIFILIGTLISCVLFVGLSFADNMQLTQIKDVTATASVEETAEREAALTVLYDADIEVKGEKITEKFTKEEFLSIKTTDEAYSDYVVPARQTYAWSKTAENPAPLIIFISVLLCTLVSMGSFRSPAVALMPDVTPKPLRSKANAIINLMGTIAGAIVLVLGIVFGTGKVQNSLMSYTLFFSVIAGLMLIALTVFMLTVREPAWSKEASDISKAAGIENEEAEKLGAEGKRHLSKGELRSLILILASVALWFIGYNAVTSKYSVYASQVLGRDYNTTLIIALGVAAVAFIPVGIISSKIGRRKMILVGVAMLTAAFAVAAFLGKDSPAWLMNILFGLAGIGWASINVNSFPMVVELATGSDVGKYTGFYYAASMAAQVVAPVLSGPFLDIIDMKALFPFGAIFVALSFVTMFFVKHGDSKPIVNKETILDNMGDND
ncbi:MAG: MFS transporter, partial [Clostridia bacterium]|nr:MFS transporter [Clostridia bacterium]